jgi:replicative DNA helicase
MDSLDKKMLAYALYEKSLAIKVVDRVPTKILRPEFRPFLAAVGECVRKYNEVPTVEMLQRCDTWEDNFTEKFNEAQEIKNDESFEPANFLLDLEDLKERYKKNTILKVGKTVFKENWNGSEFQDLQEAAKCIKKMAGELDQLEANKTYKEGTVAATAVEAKDEYVRRRENPDVARGILTGVRELDRITNGLQTAELVLIGGESGSGKSTLAMNMAINAWLGTNQIPRRREPIREFTPDGVNVMYFTVEMPFHPFRRRFDACSSEVPLYGLRDGTLTPQEENQYFTCLEFQEIYPKQFHITDIPRGCTVAQIESKYLELMYEFVPELVVVDYISLMKVQYDSESDWLNLGRLAEMLHEFCRTYNIPCITPVQLNRPKPGSGDALPDQHRVGRSSMLPQNCNIMLNIQTRQDEDTRSDMVINIAKMRDGETGAFTLYKRFDMMKLYNDPLDDWQPELESDDHV